MKTLKFNKLILLFIGLLAFNSCVEDDDFSIPDTSVVEPDISNDDIRTISSLAGDLAQKQSANDNIIEPQPLDYSNENEIVSYEFNETDEFITGYVVSSDEAGNYFEELIIQDNFENPTIGIKILIDVNPLFIRYDVGQKIFIKINGLAVGISNGVLTLGTLNGTNVDKITASQENQIIQRSNEVANIVPLPLNISDFTTHKTNLMIGLTDVQFSRDDVINNMFTYASESFDQFDGERNLESCNSSASVIFSTSTFADFRGLALPTGRGDVTAVLLRNFEGDAFIVAVNTPEDVNLDNPERCDPIELSCGLAATTGAVNLFEDDFETQSPNTLISGNGWTNFIEEGTEGWEAYVQGGTNSSQGISARVSARNSGDTSTIAWLITPEIDLNANNGVTFNFETSNSFSDGSNMEVLLSDDWDGTEAGVATATWSILSDAYITQDDDFFGDWFESGNVDLSCGSGQINIAFKYTGNDNDNFDGTYELDFVSIDAQ